VNPEMTGQMRIVLHILIVAVFAPTVQGEALSPLQEWQTFASVFRREKPSDLKRKIEVSMANRYVKHLDSPEHPEHLQEIAGFYFHLGNYNEAARWYHRSLHVMPDNLEATAWFAECLYHAGSPVPALRVLENLAERDRGTPWTLNLQSEIYFYQGKFDESRDLLERILVDTENQADEPGLIPLRNHIKHNLAVLRETPQTETK
jgi:tetratricopeptide (TPR) repeat protein